MGVRFKHLSKSPEYLIKESRLVFFWTTSWINGRRGNPSEAGRDGQVCRAVMTNPDGDIEKLYL